MLQGWPATALHLLAGRDTEADTLSQEVLDMDIGILSSIAAVLLSGSHLARGAIPEALAFAETAYARNPSCLRRSDSSLECIKRTVNSASTFDPDAFSQELSPAKFSSFSTESADSGRKPMSHSAGVRRPFLPATGTPKNGYIFEYTALQPLRRAALAPGRGASGKLTYAHNLRGHSCTSSLNMKSLKRSLLHNGLA